jgi:hypothetical protein
VISIPRAEKSPLSEILYFLCNVNLLIKSAPGGCPPQIGHPTHPESHRGQSNEDGIYPDSADKDLIFKHRELKIVKLFLRHRNVAIHWFQIGHPMKSWITDSEGMLLRENSAKGALVEPTRRSDRSEYQRGRGRPR